jgi:hypothetical protein
MQGAGPLESMNSCTDFGPAQRPTTYKGNTLAPGRPRNSILLFTYTLSRNVHTLTEKNMDQNPLSG